MKPSHARTRSALGPTGSGLARISAALVALACGVALASCAAGAQKAAVPAPAASHETAAGAQSPMPGDRHDEIEQLEQKIAIDRAQLQLTEPTQQDWQGTPATPMSVAPSADDPKCRPAQNETCKTSCTLSDSICDNANRICKIAEGLPGDTWAIGKCAKANTTCEQSRTKCCGCQ